MNKASKDNLRTIQSIRQHHRRLANPCILRRPAVGLVGLQPPQRGRICPTCSLRETTVATSQLGPSETPAPDNVSCIVKKVRLMCLHYKQSQAPPSTPDPGSPGATLTWTCCFCVFNMFGSMDKGPSTLTISSFSTSHCFNWASVVWNWVRLLEDSSSFCCLSTVNWLSSSHLVSEKKKKDQAGFCFLSFLHLISPLENYNYVFKNDM